MRPVPWTTCRHAPHGAVGASVGVWIATATSVRASATTAAKIALRSAHDVRPYDAFSTFAPEKMRPSSASTAAPTLPGSVAGHFPYPGGNVYGAPKAFVDTSTFNSIQMMPTCQAFAPLAIKRG